MWIVKCSPQRKIKTESLLQSKDLQEKKFMYIYYRNQLFIKVPWCMSVSYVDCMLSLSECQGFSSEVHTCTQVCNDW